ncbi:MAG: DNA polymerase III subunit delta, partial [Candidatus Zixiibacteriota bacterium]
MTPKQLLAEVSAGKFRPIYYFYGTEDYRIVEAEKYIAHQFLPDRQIVVNYHRVNGSKTGCADLVAELSVYPMLGERQVIAVTNFQRYKPKEIDRLRKVLDPPDTNRVVVFSSPGAKAPKESSAFFKKVAGFAQQVKFGRLDRRDCVATIVRGLAGAGLDIEPEARDMLVELVAGNRGAIETEVAKLIDFVEPGQTVSTDDVRSVAAGFQVYTVFGLMDEIVRGDRIAALRSLKRLLTEGTSATGMLYIIGQHIISLYLVKH